MLAQRGASAQVGKGEGNKGSRGAGEKRPGQEMISGSLLKSSVDFDRCSSCSYVCFGPDLTLILG